MKFKNPILHTAAGVILASSLFACRMVSTQSETSGSDQGAGAEVGTTATAPQIARFTAWLDLIDKDLKGRTPTDAADRLVSGNARETAFLLQAIGRLYKDEADEFSTLRKTYKNLEDAIGTYGKWLDLYNQSKARNSDAEVIAKLRKNRDTSRVDLEKFLISSNLVPSDTNATAYNQHFRSFIGSYGWKNAVSDRQDMLNAIKNELEDIKSAPWDFTHLEEGKGVHEFRRQMRWVSMEARSLNGMITLKSASGKCPVDVYKDVVNDPIAKTKYAVLPGADSEPNPIQISACLYVQLAKLVDVVGSIKGRIEVDDNLATKGEALDSVTDADAKSIQKILDEALANNLFGLLQEELFQSEAVPASPAKPLVMTIPQTQKDFYSVNKVHEIEISAKEWSNLANQQPKGGHCVFGFTGKQYDWFQFEEMKIDGVSFKNIGARKKSWCGSQSETKPSMNIDLVKFDKENKAAAVQAFGIDSLILNNSVQDPSYVRQCLAYRFLETAGIPSPLCNFARVKVNGNDMGLYINVQPITKPYLRSRFGANLGNIYEVAGQNFRPADMTTYLADLDSLMDVKNNSGADLKAVVDILNTQPFDLEKLKKVVDLNYIINFWAAEMVLSDWDGIFYNNNNTFLYFTPSGKMRFLPWGKDQILQRTSDAETKTVYTQDLLGKRLASVPEVKSKVQARVNELLYLYFNENDLVDDASNAARAIKPFLSKSEQDKQGDKVGTLLANIKSRKSLGDYKEPSPAPARVKVKYPLNDEGSAAPVPTTPTPKPETPKPEAPKPTPKPETPKPEAPKPEAPKPEAPKPETPKPVTPKPVTPKPEVPKPTPKPEAPKPETPKPSKDKDDKDDKAYDDQKDVKVKNSWKDEFCLNTQVHGSEKVINIFKCAKHADQTWDITSLGNGTYRIRNPATNDCVNFRGGAKGSPTEGHKCESHDDQAWKIKDLGKDRVMFENKAHANLCLAIDKAKEGQVVIVEKCDKDEKAQVWIVK